MKICLFDHSEVEHFGLMAGGSGIFDELFNGLNENGIDVTYIISQQSNSNHKVGDKVIILSIEEINKLRFGESKVSKYFKGDIFHSMTSGHHANFDLGGFKGRWVATCHGSDGEDAAAEFLVFVGRDQMHRHCSIFNSHLRSNRIYVAYNCFQDGLKRTRGLHNNIVHLSAIRPDKGVHLLPLIAQSIQREIHIYGSISNSEYFEKEILPHVGNGISYHGPIDSVEQKNKMFSTADVFVHPAVFPEPFGITLVESMICGVPFVGFESGSLPELKPRGGVLAKDVDELSEILKHRMYLYNESKLINHALKFNADNMVLNYLRIYRDVMAYPY